MTFLCQNVDLFYLYQVLFTCFPFLPRTYRLPPPSARADTHTHTPTPHLPTYLPYSSLCPGRSAVRAS